MKIVNSFSALSITNQNAYFASEYYRNAQTEKHLFLKKLFSGYIIYNYPNFLGICGLKLGTWCFLVLHKIDTGK